jgi:hypothetical protein
MGDVIVKQIFGKEVFSWGEKSYPDRKHARESYIAALKKADKEDLIPLIKFSRA